MIKKVILQADRINEMVTQAEIASWAIQAGRPNDSDFRLYETVVGGRLSAVRYNKESITVYPQPWRWQEKNNDP
jgi:hypothetical protein